MKLRVARHTNKLKEIIRFYTELIGLKVVGKFENHDAYNGVFLSGEFENWELEFTSSDETPNHQFDEDDLLVFYAKSTEEYEIILKRFESLKVKKTVAKNPYWKLNGTLYLDPDGFGVMIAKPRSA